MIENRIILCSAYLTLNKKPKGENHLLMTDGVTDEETHCFSKSRKAILLRERSQVKLYSDCPGGSGGWGEGALLWNLALVWFDLLQPHVLQATGSKRVGHN